MSEIEPTIRFNVGDEPLECSPRNTTLYRHLAHYAFMDHIFKEDEEQDDDGKKTGKILFLRPALSEEKISDVTLFMLNNEYECHLNIQEPSQSDLDAYEGMIGRQVGDIPDTLPLEWGDDRETEE